MHVEISADAERAVIHFRMENQSKLHIGFFARRDRPKAVRGHDAEKLAVRDHKVRAIALRKGCVASASFLVLHFKVD